MNKLLIALLIVLFLPGLALLVAVMVRVMLKGTRPSSRETPSAREEEPPPPNLT
jgi:flagellar basal body-associated protein FliL